MNTEPEVTTNIEDGWSLYGSVKCITPKYQIGLARTGEQGRGLLYKVVESKLKTNLADPVSLQTYVPTRDKLLVDQEDHPDFSPADRRERELMTVIHEYEEFLKLLKEVTSRSKFIKDLYEVDDDSLPTETSVIHKITKAAYEAGRADQARESGTIGINSSKANSDRKAMQLAPIIDELKQKGVHKLQDVADALNQTGNKTKTGHIWYPSTVKLLLKRIEAIQADSNEVHR